MPNQQNFKTMKTPKIERGINNQNKNNLVMRPKYRELEICKMNIKIIM